MASSVSNSIVSNVVVNGGGAIDGGANGGGAMPMPVTKGDVVGYGGGIIMPMPGVNVGNIVLGGNSSLKVVFTGEQGFNVQGQNVIPTYIKGSVNIEYNPNGILHVTGYPGDVAVLKSAESLQQNANSGHLLNNQEVGVEFFGDSQNQGS